EAEKQLYDDLHKERPLERNITEWSRFQRNEPPPLPVPVRKPPQSHSPPQEDVKPPICTHCGKVGHNEPNCWAKHGRSPTSSTSPEACRYCKTPGHTLNECQKESPSVHAGPLSFILDTGAEINIIKEKALPVEAKDCSKDVVKLSGISEGSVTTLGSAKLSIFGTETIVHIVSNDFPIRHDGVLGSSYFETTNAAIDYSARCLRMDALEIPFSEGNIIKLPPRSKKQISIALTHDSPAEGYMPKLELDSSIHIGNALLTNQQGHAQLYGINTSEDHVTVTFPCVKLQEIPISNHEEGALPATGNPPRAPMEAEDPVRTKRKSEIKSSRKEKYPKVPLSRGKAKTRKIRKSGHSPVTAEANRESATDSCQPPEKGNLTSLILNLTDAAHHDDPVSSPVSPNLSHERRTILTHDHGLSFVSSETFELQAKDAEPKHGTSGITEVDSAEDTDLAGEPPLFGKQEKSIRAPGLIAHTSRRTDDHSEINSSPAPMTGRTQAVMEQLDLDTLTEEELQETERLIRNSADRYRLAPEPLRLSNAAYHEIITVDDTPIRAKIYRYPPAHKEEIRKQISEMLEQEIIQPSTSPYSSPLWVIPKKPDPAGNKKWRLVIDY
ncbi:hypothetical protein KM043_018876, partial [Ampulex compressa]